MRKTLSWVLHALAPLAIVTSNSFFRRVPLIVMATCMPSSLEHHGTGYIRTCRLPDATLRAVKIVNTEHLLLTSTFQQLIQMRYLLS